MNVTETRRRAETAASAYLEMRGYQVIERNWQRPRAKIDIIAEKDSTVFFVEVRYHDDTLGVVPEAITKTKLNRLHFAADSWVAETKWSGASRLSSVEIAGHSFAVISFIDNVD